MKKILKIRTGGKLSLTSETLRNLTPLPADRLAGVAGGTGPSEILISGLTGDLVQPTVTCPSSDCEDDEPIGGILRDLTPTKLAR